MTQKTEIYNHCKKIISDQVNGARAELKKLQEMEGEETKSSAGDKYETGRAMIFLEKEKISIRLSESLKKQQTLDQIKLEKVSETVQMGSLVRTDKAIFFIATALGNISGDCYVISPVSPLGKALTGKKTGDSAQFNKTTYKILEIS